MLDFRNVNTLWASVLVETLARLGLRYAVVSPGSRSTPLTVALVAHPKVEAIPVLDERSASFWALGLAKASGRATILVCTSGTAGANYWPAVVEAWESQVPLLVLTADRPPELRACSSGQTIDQQKLFGDFVQRYVELALPEAAIAPLRYLRQTIVSAWQQAHGPIAGPLHLNCPFRDPLAPIPDDAAHRLRRDVTDSFFDHLTADGVAGTDVLAGGLSLDPTVILPPSFGQTNAGMIIAGPATPQQPESYCRAIAQLAQTLGWPVLAEGLSPLRNWAGLNPNLVIHYDAILRHEPHRTALAPQQVIQCGPLPTSKELRQWLATTDPLRWVLEPTGRNRDPLHGRAIVLPVSVEALAAQRVTQPPRITTYCQHWQELDRQAQHRLTTIMKATKELFEAKISWLLPQILPPGMPVSLANSMPVRDVEWFWPGGDRRHQPYFNRGANGIDGTLSTALGVAHHHGKGVLLTGDLAFLHDTNGLLTLPNLRGHLTIILVNNDGGGIFEMLPISEFNPPFEAFFAMPQRVDLHKLCNAYSVDCCSAASWEELTTLLSTFPESGVRVIEVKTSRKHDTELRREILMKLADPNAS
ncbi:MAG: 2-succinyl-5-enolpyruvyl-6-hydroxy-3-cyclohexene-1-carboxylic-acid synthase [Leptolyngbyaceae cyanobacterium T60_A2020_046]|nr:2-succinyl-5-enolpyruvyl-6-hydroxy-3-cyclohexene-1-carboxylic-acid synthase [Leptolyngbyaceae cyanobacterium T60_A2020_046]